MISKWGGLKIDENRGYTQLRLFYRENADSPGLGICLGYFETDALQDHLETFPPACDSRAAKAFRRAGEGFPSSPLVKNNCRWSINTLKMMVRFLMRINYPLVICYTLLAHLQCN
jgi:hypothetical protein